MRLIKNIGTGRVLDPVSNDLQPGSRVDAASHGLSLLEMLPYQALLQQAIVSVGGKSQKRAGDSLFSLSGAHTKQGEFAGMGDFEVVVFLVIV